MDHLIADERERVGNPSDDHASRLTPMRFLVRQAGKGPLGRLALSGVALALLDLLGLAVILPYLSLLALDTSTADSAYVRSAYRVLGSHSHADFITRLSFVLIGFFALKFVLNYLLYRMRFQANSAITVKLSDDLLRLLLNADYGYLSNRSVSEMTGVINAETIHATICLDSWVTIGTETLFLLLILTTITVIDFRLALVMVAMLLLVSALLYAGILKRVSRLGASQAQVHLRQYRFLFSIVSAIKDIKILGLESSTEKEHRLLNAQYAQAITSFNVLQTLPRGVIELLMMVGLLGACLYTLLTPVDIRTVLPLIGFLAVSSLRVVPAYSRVVGAYSSFKYYRPALDVVRRLFEDLSPRQAVAAHQPGAFRHALEVRNLEFSHGAQPVLIDVSLTIRKGSSVGVVGLSGSGKTTFLDVLAGLRRATRGQFLLDGHPFDPFRSDTLRRLLGYVPQNVTLLDDTIAFNIAFDNQPSMERLEAVARAARLETFMQSLPDGFLAMVGENGVRVSGGQKQRIGIARALYRDPEILIFDEATSSLDNVTERELSEEIAALAGEKTLVIVAHRLSTVVGCDVIHMFEDGRIACSGTHMELLASCEAYRRLYRLDPDAGSPAGTGAPGVHAPAG